MTEAQYKRAFRDLRLLFGTAATVDEQDFLNWGMQSVDAMRELLREFCEEERKAGRVWSIREKSVAVKIEDYKTGKARKCKIAAWQGRLTKGELNDIGRALH